MVLFNAGYIVVIIQFFPGLQHVRWIFLVGFWVGTIILQWICFPIENWMNKEYMTIAYSEDRQVFIKH